MDGGKFGSGGGFVAQIADEVEDGKLAIGGAGFRLPDFRAERGEKLLDAFWIVCHGS
jgi:hypothetical protein